MTVELEQLNAKVAGLRDAVAYCYGASVRGDLIEFGTMSGYSSQVIASMMCSVEREWTKEPRHLYLCDSFVGLPTIKAEPDLRSPHVSENIWVAGSMRDLNPPDLQKLISELLPNDRFSVVVGWYSQTIPLLSADTMFGFVHVDCDLYQSTMDAMDPLFARGQIADGCVICFDDWNCNRGSNYFGERLAFSQLKQTYHIEAECSGTYGWASARFIVHGYDDRSAHL